MIALCGLEMSGLLIVMPYFGTLYMIKSPVFVFAITQHLTTRSHAPTNYSEHEINANMRPAGGGLGVGVEIYLVVHS